MKYLRWVGLMSSLLLVGMLGGFLAPPPSEAGTPTLRLKVDSGAVTTIPLTAVSCTSSESTSFTQCYTIGTTTVTGAGLTTNRSYRVQSVAGAQARLRVGDKSGQDIFSIIGVQFIPTVSNWGSAAANATEKHVLTLTMSMAFDNATVNVNNGNGALYAWGVRAGGEIRPGPTTAGACSGSTTTGLCDAVGDKIDFPGTGTFSPTLQNKAILNTTGSVNIRPLSLSIAGPKGSTKPVFFDGKSEKTLGQISPTYPKFACDVDGANTGTNSCRPTITQTMTVTLLGPDSLVLTGGADGMGANCAEMPSPDEKDKQEKQDKWIAGAVTFLKWVETQRPDRTWLRAIIAYLEGFLNTANRTGDSDPECPFAPSKIDRFFATQIAQDQFDFIRDGAVPAEPAESTPSFFTGLGFFPSGGGNSFAWDVSSDGSVVVGQALGATFFEPARWEVGTNPESLNPGKFGISEAVSEDGAVVVGWGENTPGVPRAFRWTSGTGLVDLGTLSLGLTSYAKDVSADGTVVVGYSDSSPPVGFPPPPPGFPNTQAFRWTEADGMVGLGTLPGVPILDSYAYAVSADGSVIVGQANNGVSGYELFRWTAPGPIQGLGVLHATPNAVSDDGSIIVGSIVSSGSTEAFFWSQAIGGHEILPRLPGTNGAYPSVPRAVSANGSIIVGGAMDSSDVENAVIWRKTGPGGTWAVETLKDYLLANHSFNLPTGWSLVTAEGISADGKTIVGWGINPSNSGEAWKIQLPLP